MWWNALVGGSILLGSVSKFVRNSIASGKLMQADDIQSAKHINEIEKTYGGDSSSFASSFRVSKYPSKTTMGFM